MTENPIQNKRRNLYSLQALRGVAALLVLLFHLTLNLESVASINFLNGFFEFGNSGVEIFFVLSGFIISYTSHTLIATGRIKEYIFKRLVRVYPIYWVVITFFFIPAIFLGLHSGYITSFFNLLSTYLLFPKHLMINGVSWSLSYEVYFYALFALLIISRKFLFVFYFIFSIVILQILGFLTFSDDLLSKFFFSPYVLLFFMGMIVFYLFDKKLFSPNPRVCLIGITLCVSAFLLYAQNFHQLPFSSLFYGLITAFLIFFSTNLEIAGNAKVPHLFVLLGDASYVLYLIHLPILNLFIKTILKFTLNSAVIIFLVTLCAVMIVYISVIIHKKLEMPLIHLIRQRIKS